MPQRTRCVFDCDHFDVLHRFPKPFDDRFRQWKEIVGERLEGKTDNEIHTNYRICNHHFESQYFYPRSKRLARTAYPTLNLDVPAFIQEVSTITDFQAEREQDHYNPSCSSDHHLEISVKSQAGTSLIQNQRKLLVAKLLRKIEILKKKLLEQKNEVKAAKRMSKTKLFNKALKSLTKPAQTLINMQLTQHKKKSRGRRFTNMDKLLALSIYKKSPKAYNFLGKLFTLPSKRTLQGILKLISIRPGLNPEIFEKIKDTACKLSREDKLCQIMFDEMSVSPSLHFDTGLDEICGFEDFGEANRNNNIADHVILFMIKGIKAQYKQPVCFAFCKSATKAVILKNLLKKIIKELFAAGLIVISTVCDQSTINNKVINDLLEETKAIYYRKGEEARELAFEIANEKIYPLFDPPHLLKGIRNNLITKDLYYIQDGKKKIAKWDHLKLLLNIDSGEDDLRMCNKLTEAHVLPEKIPKMKVKHAAQVFSQRVSSALRFCANHKLLPHDCTDTADILLLFDHLFDSFNGSSYKKSHKTYKSCLKSNSEHFSLWDKALPILRTMQFKRETKKRDGTVVFCYEQVPSIKNWIHNINSMKDLWHNIKSKHNITCILTRCFNQDPVENFFSCVRSHGARNINPTCQQFLSIYKTLLVNNLNSDHSMGANCEEDSNKILSKLDSLLTKNEVPPRINEHILTGEMDIDLEENLASSSISQDPENIIVNETKKYVAGYIIKRLKMFVCKSCHTCANELCETTPPNVDDYINFIDVTRRSLQRPSQNFLNYIKNIIIVIKGVLKNDCHRKGLTKKMKLIIDSRVDYNFLTCDLHKKNINIYIVKLVLKLIVHSWCNNINKILKGRQTKIDECDKIKVQALTYYQTHRRTSLKA